MKRIKQTDFKYRIYQLSKTPPLSVNKKLQATVIIRPKSQQSFDWLIPRRPSRRKLHQDQKQDQIKAQLINPLVLVVKHKWLI